MAGPGDIMFAFRVLMKVEACFGEKSNESQSNQGRIHM